jgi:hypothetical protein
MPIVDPGRRRGGRTASARAPPRTDPGTRRRAPSGPISRILYAGRFSGRRRDHSSGPEVSLGLEQPTRKQLTGSESGRAPSAPLFGLAPHGVYRAPAVAGGAVRSYRTVSPLPSFRRAVCSLWHFPSRRRDRELPGMPPVWSSDFPLRAPLKRSPERSRGPLGAGNRVTRGLLTRDCVRPRSTASSPRRRPGRASRDARLRVPGRIGRRSPPEDTSSPRLRGSGGRGPGRRSRR